MSRILLGFPQFVLLINNSPIVTTPPPLNSGVSIVVPGDELVQLAYTDSLGTLYDAQFNLTKSWVKIYKEGVLYKLGALSANDVSLIRQASHEGTLSPALLAWVGILVGLAGIAITIGYPEYKSGQDGQRQYTAANVVFAQQWSACIESGGKPSANRPSLAMCGADASFTCVPAK